MGIASNLTQLFIFRSLSGRETKRLTQKNSKIARERALSIEI